MSNALLFDAPSSEEAEKALVGAILIDGDMYADCMSVCNPDDFFMLRHQYIWQAYEKLYLEKTPIDSITIADKLETMGVLETIGGRSYLMQLSMDVGSSMHAPVYAELVHKLSVRRAMLKALDDMRCIVLDEAINLDAVIRKTDHLWMKTTSSEDAGNIVSIAEATSLTFDRLSIGLADKDIAGIRTHLRDVDNITRGFQDGEFVIFAGRPGMGKSSLVQQIALHAALYQGRHIVMFITEMSEVQVVQRFISIIAGVPIVEQTNNKMGAKLAIDALGKISKLPITFDTTSAPSPSYIRAKVQWLRARGLCDAVVIDGLYMMSNDPDMNKYANQNQQGEVLANAMKAMAKDFKIPVIATHQLNRDVESRADKRPNMADLRSSGGFEQAADKIALLYRDDYYNPLSDNPNMAEFILAKNRNGATGSVVMWFEKQITKFVDATVTRVELPE